MGIIERTYGKDTDAVIDEVLISSDSHVIEPAGLWKKNMPQAFKDRAPDFGGQRPNDVPGGAQEKDKRVSEMAADGVSGEVLYPTHGLKCLSLDDREMEAACCRVYNDWLIDYCSAAPDRMIGIAMLSMYDIDGAVKELERCRQAGMRGSVIWQVPPAALPFSSPHYDKFWAASQDLDMPVNLHILSGHGYSRSRSFGQGDTPTGLTREHNNVNMKLFQSVDSLYDLIYSGVLERFPKLKIVLGRKRAWLDSVRVGAMGLLLQTSWHQARGPQDQKTTQRVFSRPDLHDFFQRRRRRPHLILVGPRQLHVVQRLPPRQHDLAQFSPRRRPRPRRSAGGVRAKLVRENVSRLYNIPVPSPVQ